ncbi:G-protein coupled receptor 55-like [Spea bombifrons]|uniref:G-protein coupled receptor 55-like n=1 Tax=Spea bombifrons TaxID=233779 RepID=UPI00234A96F8|nr:G-protein coupled receptor 55-like [Spea bombifrons]
MIGNHSHCSFSDVNAIVNKLQLVIYIPTFITGSILNVVALWVFCFSMKRRTEVSIYLMNLAILDLLLLLSLPFKMYFSQQNTTGYRSLCSFVESLYFTNMYGSIYTIALISLDRYIAIKHPFWSKLFRSPKKTATICIFIWLFVWSVSACVFTFDFGKEKVRCFHNMSDHVWSSANIISVEVFGFLIPLMVMLFCSIQTIRALLIHKPYSIQFEELRIIIIRIVVSNLVVFLLSFLPPHVGIFLQFLVRQNVISECSSKKNISLLVQLTLCLTNVNCCLDAICYYFSVKEFRSKYLRNHSIGHMVELPNI